MKKQGIINGKLMGILAGLGHTDKIFDTCKRNSNIHGCYESGFK